MIDFHSHILPGIDDGSRNVEESMALLGMLRDQGIKTVVATPHYNAKHRTPEEFIERRQRSYETLLPYLDDSYPEILLGAEVGYYPGIEKLPNIQSLCAGSSNLLLLEMPISEWSDYVVREVIGLASAGGMNVVLAHVERYIGLQSSKTVKRLAENGILMQCNANQFLRFGQKRKMLSALGQGKIHFIGSDCHDLEGRAPRIGQAYELIRNKLGNSFCSSFCRYGYSMLNKKSTVKMQ